MKKIFAYLLPQPRDILFIGIFFVMLYGGPRLFNNDGDLALHTTIGNYILDAGRVPTQDIFSYTRQGVRFVAHEWLAEVAYAVAYRLMGLSGDVFLAALLAAITILIVYEELVKRGHVRVVALFVTAWVAAVASVHWLARPHMFTFLFVAIWTYGLERVYVANEKRLWFFPLLMLIWANTHGAFFAGFVIWGTYLADWLWESVHGRGSKEMGTRLLLIGGSSLAITFINPSGWHLWGTSVGFVSNGFLTNIISEYASPNFHEKDVWPFLFMVAFALLSLMLNRKIQTREALLLAGWGALSLISVRNMSFFAVVNAPVYAMFVKDWSEEILGLFKQGGRLSEKNNVLRGYTWIVIAILFFGYVLWSGIPIDEKRTGNVYLPDKMPIEAMDWLETNPQSGRMFNDYVWGGYILFRTWPQQTVFVDARTDFFGEALMREYFEVAGVGSNWQNVLDKYEVTWLFISRHGTLAEHLYDVDVDPWNVIYEDDTAIIFRREPVSP